MTISARLRHFLALGVLLAALAPGAAARIGAQPVPGAICVATFADLNGNAIRDEGEPPLAGVTVNLSTGGQVIATHVMAEGEAQYCFENLATGAYTITFQSDPATRSTTANEGTFNLDEGQRLTITDYGAVPASATTAQADLVAETSAVVLETTTDEAALRQPVRLAISAAGAVAVMVFMLGVGAIVLGVRGLGPRRRARPAPRYPQHYPPPPRQITPPRA